jgi:shikimate kinase|tara:strand:- start:582 stop:1076 length:495 start_codon:yes stop_codon:yes gene_type:complete
MNIFLIGFMGVGKTTVGKILAKKLNYDFMDPDDKEHWVKRGFPKGQNQASRHNGEYYEVQTDILKDYIKKNVIDFVYSTDGSIVLRDENIELMKSNGKIIYLSSDAKTLCGRILQQGKAEYSLEDTKEHMKSREHKYKIADFEIDTSNNSAKETCSSIISLLGL